MQRNSMLHHTNLRTMRTTKLSQANATPWNPIHIFCVYEWDTDTVSVTETAKLGYFWTLVAIKTWVPQFVLEYIAVNVTSMGKSEIGLIQTLRHDFWGASAVIWRFCFCFWWGASVALWFGDLFLLRCYIALWFGRKDLATRYVLNIHRRLSVEYYKANYSCLVFHSRSRMQMFSGYRWWSMNDSRNLQYQHYHYTETVRSDGEDDIKLGVINRWGY